MIGLWIALELCCYCNSNHRPVYGLVRLSNEVKNAWAQIDVQLKGVMTSFPIS